MNITRNNYENYFLLYADGELDAGGVLEVERFAALHPDLAEELEMLMETVLGDENISMPGKEMLLKPELWNEENISPRQEAMMQLLDNELEKSEADKLASEISTDTSLQKDWNILLQSKLVAPAVEMPGKATLYRYERDRKPIPIGGWVKWMAAAAVVAGLGWFGLNLLDNKENNAGVAHYNAPVIKTKPANSTPVIKPNTVTAEPIISSEPAMISVADRAKQQTMETARKTTPVKQEIQEQPTTVEYASNTNQQLVEVVPETDIPANTVATLNPNEINNPILKPIQNTEPVATIAQQAAYYEDAVDEDTEYVNIAGARIKKQKLRGVFRNVTRTIGRTFDKSNVAQADVATLR